VVIASGCASAESTPTPAGKTYGTEGTDDAALPPLGIDAGMRVQCNPIVNGTSSLDVNGTTRKFEVQLPTNTSSNKALLFLWHGWNLQASTFASTIR
jgi:poly(3-hydroxybutyrate) depolymerase